MELLYPSPLAMTLVGDSLGDEGGYLEVFIEVTDVFAEGDLYARGAWFENHIATGGGDYYNEVVRDVLPQEPLTISQPGETVTIRWDFTFDPSWNRFQMGAAAFVQSDENKVVLQALSLPPGIFYPFLSFEGMQVNDESGDNDGRAEEGETVDLVITLHNAEGWKDASSATGTIRIDDSAVSVTDSTGSWGPIPAGTSGTNDTDPFVFSVDPGAPAHRIWVEFEAHAEPGGVTLIDTFELMIGHPDLLLVDDDNGLALESKYRTALDSLNYEYDLWEVATEGAPHLSGPSGLDMHRVVIWFTGQDSTTSLTAAERDTIEAFLNNGTHGLFLTGQNIGDGIGGEDFYSQTLHASDEGDTSNNFIDGVEGDPIGDSFKLIISNQPHQDVLSPLGEASIAFEHAPGQGAGIRFDGSYRLVYLGFGFEGVSRAVGYTTPEDLMERIVDWLLEWSAVHEENDHKATHPTFGIGQMVPNPFRSSVRINFAVPPSPSESEPTTLRIYDVSGRLVVNLVERNMKPGRHAVTWNGLDERGRPVASGIYFAILTRSHEIARSKMLLVR
jgi:hypothetical protein